MLLPVRRGARSRQLLRVRQHAGAGSDDRVRLLCGRGRDDRLPSDPRTDVTQDFINEYNKANPANVAPATPKP